RCRAAADLVSEERITLMRIDAVPIGFDPPHDINVIVEVPIGGEPVKYEMDKASGTLFVDRMLHTAMRYPGNYGFVPHTLSADGDPIDVLIANQRPLIPGCVINCRPVGVLLMSDEKGGDEKLIAVPSSRVTARYERVATYRDLPESLVRQIAHFFEHYTDIEEGKCVRLDRWGDEEEARELVRQAMAHPNAR